ncbi:unnamed protein product [Sphagnum balticum]
MGQCGHASIVARVQYKRVSYWTLSKGIYMRKITIENAEKLIKSTNGAIFSVSFVKANGETREMTCRLGVRKGLTGKGLTYDPSSYDLLTVYDMTKQDYRAIRLTALKRLTVDGKAFAVIQ